MRGSHGNRPTKKGRRSAEALNPRQRKDLQRAHQLMETGGHANAADLIERIAQSIYDVQMLRMAPRLFVQAGRARILAGEVEAGLALLQKGLEIWADSGRKSVLIKTYQRLSQELPGMGFEEAAGSLSSWLKERYPKVELPEDKAPPGPSAHRGTGLPLKCPECEGPLHPDEVDWKGSSQGECPYCGSFIPG
jgi:hypothetical protein